MRLVLLVLGHVFHALRWLALLLHRAAKGVGAATCFAHVRDDVVLLFAFADDYKLLLTAGTRVAQGCIGAGLSFLGMDVGYCDGFALGTSHCNHVSVFKARDILSRRDWGHYPAPTLLIIKHLAGLGRGGNAVSTGRGILSPGLGDEQGGDCGNCCDKECIGGFHCFIFSRQTWLPGFVVPILIRRRLENPPTNLGRRKAFKSGEE